LVDGVRETSTSIKTLTCSMATLHLHFKTWCSCIPRWITFWLKLSCLWMTYYMQALHVLRGFEVNVTMVLIVGISFWKYWYFVNANIFIKKH
jgi:hypothetical protein